MKTLAKFVGASLIGAFALLAAPAAQAQVGISLNFGAPAWGPPVAQGAQYYYIPEIDGYYDLYTQQYLVNQDGYWVPLPELYGYDPYQFHPVVISYRGRQPWLQGEYYHSHYAYRPYVPYGGRGGYFAGGYGRGYDTRGYGNRGFDNRGYGNRGGYDDHGRGDDHRGGFDNRAGGFDNRGGNRGFDQRGSFDNRGGFDGHGQNPGGGFNRGNQGPAPQPAPGGQFGRGGQGGFDSGRGGQGPQNGGGRGPGEGGNGGFGGRRGH